MLISHSRGGGGGGGGWSVVRRIKWETRGLHRQQREEENLNICDLGPAPPSSSTTEDDGMTGWPG